MTALKEFFTTLAKGIVVGLGAITPGLSGSVLLVIFGLYHKALNAISTIFKNFKKNLLFLIPLALGIGTGMLLFSKIAQFFLNNYEMQTRFTFLGLVVGTIPLPAAGERLMVTGKWSTHSSYGKQFEAEFLERLMPETGGIGEYRPFVHIDVRKQKTRWQGNKKTDH